MSRILFAAHPTVGHTSALRAIGVRLRERGHVVAFAIAGVRLPFVDRWPAPLRAAAGLTAAIEADGFELLPLRPPLAMLWHATRLPSKRGYGELAVAIEIFTAGLAEQARAVAAHAERWRADVVVGDYLMPAAMLGAAAAGRPFAALYHSALPFPVEGAAPFGSGLSPEDRGSERWRQAERSMRALGATFDARVGAAAKALGAPAPRRDLLTSPISPDLNLLATVPALEPGLAPLDGPVVMIGPCLPQSARPGDEAHPALSALPRAPAEGLRAYVSLGTVFNGKPEVYRKILDGLGACGAHVVVSAGESHRALAARPRPNTHVFAFVPQVALLSQVDVVITHGGNNTVQECLAAGRPMVVLPFGGDQLVNAARVEQLGVGVGLDARSFTAGEIAAAVHRAFRQADKAAAIGAALDGHDGAGRGADEVLRLAGAGGAPLR
jgi:MGT family glycosyltransferase